MNTIALGFSVTSSSGVRQFVVDFDQCLLLFMCGERLYTTVIFFFGGEALNSNYTLNFYFYF